MAPSSAHQQHIKKGFWYSSIWMVGVFVLFGAFYIALSLDRARTNREMLETTRFTDGVVFFEKINNLLILSSISASDLPEIQWTAYRAGLFVQGKVVLSVMRTNDSFLTKKEHNRLLETISSFTRLQNGLVAGKPFPELVEIDRPLMLLSSELAGWSASNRMILYHRLHLLDYGRAILILAALSGGGFFMFKKTQLHQKTSRQNLFYQALFRIDQLILTLPSIEELLPQTCRIIVEEGGGVTGQICQT